VRERGETLFKVQAGGQIGETGRKGEGQGVWGGKKNFCPILRCPRRRICKDFVKSSQS